MCTTVSHGARWYFHQLVHIEATAVTNLNFGSRATTRHVQRQAEANCSGHVSFSYGRMTSIDPARHLCITLGIPEATVWHEYASASHKTVPAWLSDNILVTKRPQASWSPVSVSLIKNAIADTFRGSLDQRRIIWWYAATWIALNW